MEQSHFKVIVIGAGAGGSAVAWALTQRGIPVLLLEAGPWYSPEKDYLLDQPHWEKQGFPFKPGSQGRYLFGELQELQERWSSLRSWNLVSGELNQSSSRQVAGPGYHHVRGVGGSTLHFTGEAHRLHPDAMKMHSRFGVAADWPLDYQTIEPFYQVAEEVIGVAGPAKTGDRWRSRPYPLPAHSLSRASKYIQEGGKKSGFTWTENARCALSRPYDGRPACNYCANCNRGCPRRDKGSTDVTFIQKALATGLFELRPHCHVLQLVPDARKRVKEVRYADKDGVVKTVQGDVVVIASGAIETPRLLLASTGQLAPGGLANESGQVGRNLLETLAWNSSGLAETSLDSFKGLPLDAICWDYNAPDSIKGVVGGCRFTVSTAGADLIGPINYGHRAVPGWGKSHKQAMRKAFGKLVTIGSVGEFLANDDTFVEIDASHRDEHDVPLARIHSYLSDAEHRRLTFMRDTCRQMLEAAGIKGLVEEYGSYDFFSSTHVFGTCRMGSNPRDSVVDGFGRSHHWKNLFITDASIFPSSGGGEAPSLTIEALAIRTGRYIAERM